LGDHPDPGEQQPGDFGAVIEGQGYHFKLFKKIKNCERR